MISIYLEIVSLIFAVICVIYTFSSASLSRGRLGKVLYVILLSFLLFIISKVLRILVLLKVIDLKGYESIVSPLFIITFTLAIVMFNKIIKDCRSVKIRKKR